MIDIELWGFNGVSVSCFNSSYYTLQKPLNQDYECITLSQSALGVSVVLFSLVFVIVQPSVVIDPNIVYPIVAGILVGSALYSFNLSMKTTDLSIASPLQQTIPIFSALFEPLILSAIGFEPELIMAAVMATIGAYIINLESGDILSPLRKLQEKGLLLALGAAAAFDVSSVLTHFATQDIHIVTYILLQSIAGFIALSILRGDRPKFDKSISLYSILFALTFLFDVLTLSLVIASKANILFRLSLIINVLIGTLIFGENIL